MLDELIQSVSRQIKVNNQKARLHFGDVTSDGLSVWEHAMLILPNLTDLSLFDRSTQAAATLRSVLDELDERHYQLAQEMSSDGDNTWAEDEDRVSVFSAIKLLQHVINDALLLRQVNSSAFFSDEGLTYRTQDLVKNNVAISLDARSLTQVMLKPYFDEKIKRNFKSSRFKKIFASRIMRDLVNGSCSLSADIDAVWELYANFDKQIIALKSLDRFACQLESTSQSHFDALCDSKLLREYAKKQVLNSVVEAWLDPSMILDESVKQRSYDEVKKRVNEMKVLSTNFDDLELHIDELGSELLRCKDASSRSVRSAYYQYRNALREHILRLDQFIMTGQSESLSLDRDLVLQHPSWLSIIKLTEQFFSVVPSNIDRLKQNLVSSLAIVATSRFRDDAGQIISSHDVCEKMTNGLLQSCLEGKVKSHFRSDYIFQKSGAAFVNRLLSKKSASMPTLASYQAYFKCCDGDLESFNLLDKQLVFIRGFVSNQLKQQCSSPLYVSHFSDFIMKKMTDALLHEEGMSFDSFHDKHKQQLLFLLESVSSYAKNFQIFESSINQCGDYIRRARLSFDPKTASDFDQFSVEVRTAVLTSYTTLLDSNHKSLPRDQLEIKMGRHWKNIADINSRYVAKLPLRRSAKNERRVVLGLAALTGGFVALCMFCYHKIVYGEVSLTKPRSYSKHKVMLSSKAARRAQSSLYHPPRVAEADPQLLGAAICVR